MVNDASILTPLGATCLLHDQIAGAENSGKCIDHAFLLSGPRGFLCRSSPSLCPSACPFQLLLTIFSSTRLFAKEAIACAPTEDRPLNSLRK